MKKLIRNLLLIIIMLFTHTVNAEVIDKDDVPKGTYVIGTHTFDRNKTDNYDGTLTVQHIMLAAKTIESNNLEDMKIYFKNSRGKWVNPIDNSIIPDTNIPEHFEVVYQNVEVVDIEIPNVTNKTVEVAKHELTNAGFTVNTTIEKENSDTIEAGKVTKTSPSAGSIKKKGTVVTIYESLGPESIDIENYTNENIYEIKTQLELLGLRVTIEAKNVDNIEEYIDKEDIIIDQNPKSGSLYKGDQIVLYYPNIVVYPDFSTYTLEEVQEFAERYGLDLEVLEVETDDVDEGKIIYQNRNEGTAVVRGATLTVKVAVTPKTYHEKLIDLANSFPEEVTASVSSNITDEDVIIDFIGKKYLFDNNVIYDKVTATKETIRLMAKEDSNYLDIAYFVSYCGGLVGGCGGGFSPIKENASQYNINYVNLSQDELNQLNEFKSEVNEAIQEAKGSFENGTYSKLFVTNEIVKNISSKYGYDVLSDNFKYYELRCELDESNKTIWLKQDADNYFIVKNGTLYDTISFEDDYDIGIYRDSTEYKNADAVTTLSQAINNFVEATGISNYGTVSIDDKEYDSYGNDVFMQYAVFITDKDTGNMWVVIFEIKRELTVEEQLQKYLNQFPDELLIDVYNGVKDTEYSSIWHALNYKLIEHSRNNNININFKHTTEMRFENDYWLEFSVAPDATATGTFVLILSSEDKTVQKTINYQVNYTNLSGEEITELNRLKAEINEHNASIRDNVEKGIYSNNLVYKQASEDYINSKMVEYNFISYRFETQSIPIQYSGVELYGDRANYYIVKNGELIDVLSIELYSGISMQTNLIADKEVNLDEYISSMVMPYFKDETGIDNYSVKENYQHIGTIIVNELQHLYRNDYELVIETEDGTEWQIWFSQYVNL